MQMDEIVEAVTQLAARQAIMDCLLRYCRGVDRLDRDLMLSAYHADAIDDHGVVVQGATTFVDWAMAFHEATNPVHHHAISNVTIAFDGDVAHVETYFTFTGTNHAGASHLAIGRYLDRFERREGDWRIAARKSLTEAVHELTVAELPAEYAALLFGNGPRARNRTDASYQRPLRVHLPETVD